MKQLFAFILLSTLVISCSSDKPDSALEQVQEELKNGGILRTIAINSGTFDINDLNSRVNINLEESDKKNGGLLDEVDVYIRYVDRNPDNGNNSTQEIKFNTLPEASFSRASSELPRTDLDLGFNELLSATGIAPATVVCGDQFQVRLELKLTDGLIFTTENTNAHVLAMQTFNSSPFCYTINVVDRVDEDLFLGDYLYQSIVDGPNGPSFNEPQILKLERGHSPAVRTFNTFHVTSRDYRPFYDYEFTIACDETIFSKFQFTTFTNTCDFGTGNKGPVLLGPALVNAVVDPNDDSAFELWFTEGYDGYNGGCDYTNAISKIRFTKQ